MEMKDRYFLSVPLQWPGTGSARQKSSRHPSVLVHHGVNRRKKEFLAEVLNYDLVISTYALTYRDEDILDKVEWNGVVLDEAQNIKNSSTKQSQAVRRIQADYRIALTGTPVENRLSELIGR